ncbi:MAG: hypothetical protein ABI895_13845 [Deltaproteobacteria bacterium]
MAKSVAWLLKNPSPTTSIFRISKTLPVTFRSSVERGGDTYKS